VGHVNMQLNRTIAENIINVLDLTLVLQLDGPTV
jgi:hypothetical protein